MMSWQEIQRWWHPSPVEPPQVDEHLDDLDCLTRSAESLRFSLLSLEYWLSPHGWLREWLRHMARMASWLAFPALLVLPLVVILLWQVVKAVTMLAAIAGKLIILPVLVLVAAVVMLVVMNIGRWMLR